MSDSDLSSIPTDEIRTTLCETVEKQLQSKNYKITVSSASQAGESNFIGVVYRVSFWKEDDTKSPKSSQILKVAPQNAARRAQFMSRSLFLREMYMYDVVLPYFREFEQSKGVIAEENGFNEYPKCYRTLDTELSESVFLEDLSQRSFTMINKSTETVTAHHVNLVMQVLGKFHAISFALKDQQPQKFEELASELSEQFVRRDDKFIRMFFNKQAQIALDVVSDEENAGLKKKLAKLFEREALDIAADCLDESAASAGSVISHGDTWQNNTMFRYDSDGKPIEISLLDWQISRRSSPIIDIVYFVFCCTTKELRDAHYDNFLKVYHESLSAHIIRLGSDPEQLFSFETMQDHFRKFGKFGMILSTMLLPMMTAESGMTVDLDALSDKVVDGGEFDGSVFVSEKSRNRLATRLRDVIIDMVRLDYI